MTGGAGLRALDRAFHTLYGISCVVDGVSMAGKTDPAIIRQVFEKTLGRLAGNRDVEEIGDNYLTFLNGEIKSSPGYHVMEGVQELLENLVGREDVLLALGTGNLERGARIKMERGGLNPYFLFGGFGSDAEDRREVLKTAVRRGEERVNRPFALKDIFVIGDTILDVRAGKAIGAVTVAVGSGFGQEADLRASRPDLYIDSFLKAGLFYKLLN